MLSKDMHHLGSVRNCMRELFEYGRQKAKEVGADKIMDFSLGNPSVPAPAEIEQALHKLLSEESPVALHSYTSAVGDDGARTAIAASLNRRFNAGIGADNLFIIGGAAAALISCFKAVTATPKDEIIVIAPYFPEYKVFIEKSAGAAVTVVPADTKKFQIDLLALESLVNANTAAVVINSPNNPSGTLYTEETLTKLSDILRKKQAEHGRPIYLISDEPYREIVYGGKTAPYVPHLYDNTLICYSFSKSLSLPGERIGYVLVPDKAADSKDLYAAVAGAARAIGHVCAPSLMQKMVALCCDVMPDTTIYEKNSRLLYESMTKMGYNCASPDGAFYLFFEAPNGMTGQEFSDYARDKYYLLIAPGQDFGCPNHLRFSYCVPTERIEKALPYMEKLMAETRK